MPVATCSLLLDISRPPLVTRSSPRTALEAASPSPANSVARASVVVNCSLASSESSVPNQSPLVGTTALSSDKSSVKVTPELSPPPDRPTPAVTPDMSPPLDVPGKYARHLSSYQELCCRTGSLWSQRLKRSLL